MGKKKSVKGKISPQSGLNLSAEVSYSRRKTINENIPEDVTRAKSAAWLDVISPISEWAGLKGDQIRMVRDALRLHREDTLEEIANKFKKKSRRSVEINAVPVKFLVPYLEDASLEDKNSPLTDLWANLLFSASENYDPKYCHFSRIIARMSSDQAKIFEEIIGDTTKRELDHCMDYIHTALNGIYIEEMITRDITNNIDDIHKLRDGFPDTDDYIAKTVSDFLKCGGVSVVHSAFENVRSGDYYDIIFDYQTYNDNKEVDYSILEALGLIKRIETDIMNILSYRLNLIYYHITPLGCDFAKACIVKN